MYDCFMRVWEGLDKSAFAGDFERNFSVLSCNTIYKHFSHNFLIKQFIIYNTVLVYSVTNVTGYLNRDATPMLS